MRPLIALLLLLNCSICALAQTGQVEQLLSEAETAQKAYQEEKAMTLYGKVLAIEPTNLKALFGKGYLLNRKGWMLEEEQNKDQAEVYYLQAYEMAQAAYKLYPNTYEANFAMAGAIGRMAQFLSPKERVQAAWDIKKYADMAKTFNPDVAELKHLLAWWNYELTKPTWLERSLADMFFGGIPDNADMQRSIDLMKELIAYRPDYTVYSYDLAVFYNYIGDKVSAIALLKKVMQLKPTVPEDETYIKASQRLLKKLL